MRFLLCLVAATMWAQAPSADSRWKALDFLIGDWVGEGDGAPGKGSGEFSFHLELGNQILVRRSYNQMATARHEDFTVVYAESAGAPMQATYWDSEGHTIHYRLAVKGNSAVFESDPAQAGPRYRLTYLLEAKKLAGKFEIAPPGGEYKAYLNWTSRRK